MRLHYRLHSRLHWATLFEWALWFNLLDQSVLHLYDTAYLLIHQVQALQMKLWFELAISPRVWQRAFDSFWSPALNRIFSGNVHLAPERGPPFL